MECPNCHYELSAEQLKCPECGLAALEMEDVRDANYSKKIRKRDVLIIATTITISGVMTSLFHASGIGDRVFLALLVFIGMCPSFVWRLRTRVKPDNETSEIGYILVFGGVVGVVFSFWMPPQLAYSPMGGIFLAFFTILLAGPTLILIKILGEKLE